MKRLAFCLALAVALVIRPTAAAPAAAPPAGADQPKGAAPAAAQAPESIPVPEVARRGDEVGKLLRDLETLLAPGVSDETLENRRVELTARIGPQIEATDRQLEAEPTGAALDGLLGQWQATRTELVGYVNLLTQRAMLLEGALQRLAAVRQTWTRTRTEARASRAPGPVLERIDGVLAAVEAASKQLQAQRTATLVLQDRFAQQVTRCEDALGRIGAMRRVVTGRLLEPDRVALWHAGELARAVTELPQHVRTAAASDIGLLHQFVRDQRWKIPIHVALFLVLMLVMGAASRTAHLWVAPGEVPPAEIRVFDRHVSAALMIALLAFPLVYSPPIPRVVTALGMVLVLVSAVRIMRVLLDPRLMPGLYVIAAFFLADLVRLFASAVPLLERTIFLLEMLAGTAVLAWLWVSRRRSAVLTVEAIAVRQRLLRLATGMALLAFIAAFAAGAAGYMVLALLLGSGIPGNGYLALVLYAGVRVGDGLVAFALRVPPLRRLGMVRRRRWLIERRVQRLLRLVAVAAWLVLALRYFALWNSAVELTRAALGAEVRLGSVALSLGAVLVFALTVAAAFGLSALVRFALEEDVYPRLNLARGLPRALSSLLHYTLLLGGFLLALAALGVDLTKITILAGAFGVGIGFGLQNVVNNFVSGWIVLAERKINTGDAIQLGDVSGQVQQLGMRACIVRTWEGAEVIVPNAALISEKVANWTLSDRRRRVDVAVGVAYGTSPARVLDILRDVARAHPGVAAEPAPVALFLEFGESALRFVLRAWTDRFDQAEQIRSDLAVAVYAALGEAGIEIPFPQREVRLRG
jgi:small-conductance mechanosensitive channel